MIPCGARRQLRYEILEWFDRENIQTADDLSAVLEREIEASKDNSAPGEKP